MPAKSAGVATERHADLTICSAQQTICAMDDLDRRLIGLLRQDARAPVASLARALKVSRATVQSRIDRMLQRGEISGFTIRVSATGEGGACGR
jgi:DNA-binding Lrp family transcriptional regulator